MGISIRPAASFLVGSLMLVGCQGTPELGQGSSLAQGSAGSEGDGSSETQLSKCAAPIGTAALVEPDQQNLILLNTAQLPSPLPVLQLLMAQSNCFTVVERGAAIGALEAEQRRSGQQVRLRAADYMLKPNILFSNPNAGGYGGGLAGIGSMFGPIGLIAGAIAGTTSIKEAQTTLSLIDVRSGVQRAISEGSAKVTDFGGFGGLAGFGSGIGGLGGIGGYGNTAEGKLIVAALIDAHNKLIDIVGTSSAGRGGATAHRASPAYDSTLVSELQIELQASGYYNSTVDGVYGRGTRGAIVNYQEANGLLADGRPSNELLAYIRSHP